MRTVTPRRTVFRYLSLGAGVQSTTLALLAERGVLPKPDVAIFADTQWEPPAVYAHLAWLASVLSFPVIRVTAGSLRQHVMDGVAANKVHGAVYRGIPAYLRQGAAGKPTMMTPPTNGGGLVLDGETEAAKPTRDLGMGRRQCTREFKITPITEWVKRHPLGLTKGQRVPRDVLVEQWTGISTDESHRMKPAEEAWLSRLYPLIDLGFSRMKCIAWLREHGYPDPPKSSCVGCPFHGVAEWRAIRNDPKTWADAVEVDEAIRGGIVGLTASTAYLHFSGRPLVDAVPETPEQVGQGDLFNGLGNECEGVCGV